MSFKGNHPYSLVPDLSRHEHLPCSASSGSYSSSTNRRYHGPDASANQQPLEEYAEEVTGFRSQLAEETDEQNSCREVYENPTRHIWTVVDIWSHSVVYRRAFGSKEPTARSDKDGEHEGDECHFRIRMKRLSTCGSFCDIHRWREVCVAERPA
jgi:hypothetical protein